MQGFLEMADKKSERISWSVRILQFGHVIHEYKEELFSTLAELIAIPSVADTRKAASGAPFGKEAARALNLILEKASSMGFTVKNVGGYAGHAEYDSGSEGVAAVLGHVDVVPAGTGWDTDPFALTEKDGLLFGRGVLDDKGACVTALYCMKALKDHGVVGKRKLRCIFGSGEEIGMEDMPHYFAEEPLPDLAFTPDGDYGICNREKGMLRFSVSFENDTSLIRSFHSGEVANAVPNHAEAVIACAKEEAEALRNAAEALKEPCVVSFDETANTAKISMEGRAAHAREPENGRNAAAHLIRLLAQVFGEASLGTLFRFFLHTVDLDTTGKGFGIAQSDIPSGFLTLNTGMVHMEQQGSVTFDIRYPVTTDGESLIETLRTFCQQQGLRFSLGDHMVPLYAKEDSELVSVLRRAYRDVTGEDALLYSTGGGSYARCIPGRCVAFGPLFPEEPDRNIHRANEHVDKALFLRHAEICLEAMYRMIDPL